MSEATQTKLPIEKANSVKRVMVIASYAPSLVIFRLELLKRMVEAGHYVFALAPEHDEAVVKALDAIGVKFIQIPMARTGLNPFADLKTLYALWVQFRKLKPDTIMPYTMKPIIYGGIAARIANVPNRCFLVTGLGHVFSNMHSSWKLSTIRRVSVSLYQLAFAGAKVVFVYNDADDMDIRQNNMISDKSKIVTVPGSGVDLNHFKSSAIPAGPPSFLLIARLLQDKGIVEYVEAARIVRKQIPDAQFKLLGHFDLGPNGITPAQIEGWVSEGVIDFLGQTTDVRPFLSQCTAFVLPSYYREGIPRSILEALATGRAIVTADSPGCRDTVEEGVNGYIVTPRSSSALAEAVMDLAKHPSKAAAMGLKSREIAQNRFDVHVVNLLLMEQMELA
jgi:glycosyltransferase involved in cell wall biosynthesis